MVASNFWVHIFKFSLSLFSLTECRLYKKKLLRYIFLMCSFWVIARQQSMFCMTALCWLSSLCSEDCAGCCCSHLTYLPLGNQTVANTQTLTSVPPFPPGLGSEVTGSVGSRGGPLCPEPVQMPECIRLTNPHVLRARQAAKSSARGQQGEEH